MGFRPSGLSVPGFIMALSIFTLPGWVSDWSCPPCRCYRPSTFSTISLPGLKLTTFRSGTMTDSPVLGFLALLYSAEFFKTGMTPEHMTLRIF